MSLSQVRGEAALDLLADIMEPASAILDDDEVKEAFRGNKNKLKTVYVVLKRHKSEMLQILAAVNQVPVDDYRPNPFEILKSTFEILTDPGLSDFFISQDLKMDAVSSGPASENTEAPKE